MGQQIEFEHAVRQGWIKPPKQNCEHPADKLEPEILNPDLDGLRYCRACGRVVERVEIAGKPEPQWISWGPIISKIT